MMAFMLGYSKELGITHSLSHEHSLWRTLCMSTIIYDKTESGEPLLVLTDAEKESKADFKGEFVLR